MGVVEDNLEGLGSINGADGSLADNLSRIDNILGDGEEGEGIHQEEHPGQQSKYENEDEDQRDSWLCCSACSRRFSWQQ